MLALVKSKKAFTLVELMISVSIFVLMTVLLIVKYGNFNQGVLLTNTAYDIALVLRTAQTFGLSVSNAGDSDTTKFQYPYGVNLSTIVKPAPLPFDSINTRVILFADSSGNGIFDMLFANPDIMKQTYNLTRGAYVSAICTGSSDADCNATPLKGSTDNLSVTFKRPDPRALICGSASGCTGTTPTFSKFAKIQISGSDGSQRYITVSENGQISILQ